MNDVRFVELSGERIAFRDAGHGHVVVLLHGMAGSSQTWDSLIPRLAQRYRVIAPDLLGHGQSAKPRTDYSLGAFAAGLRDLLDELGIAQATIVGHSLGGGVAMQFLYQHPEYCQRLILISSGGLGPDVGWILKLLTVPGADLVLPVVASKMVLALGEQLQSWLDVAGLNSPPIEQLWQGFCSLSDSATRSAFMRTLRSVIDYRGQSVSALSRLGLRTDVPALLIWGDRDSIIPVEHGAAAVAARPGSRLEVLAGLGHFPHAQSPSTVAAKIERFIDGDDVDNVTAQQHQSEAVDPIASPRQFTNALQAHQEFEVATGVLMSLRGCSRTEAIREISSAAEEMQLDASELACAVLDLPAGSHNSPHRDAVAHRWRHLLMLRGLAADSGTATEHPVRARYGPENDAVVC